MAIEAPGKRYGKRLAHSKVFGHPHGAKSVNADLNVTLFFRFWDRLMGTELPSYERVFRAAPGPRAEAREPRGAVQSAP